MGLFDAIGNIFGIASQAKANKQNIAFQRETNAQQLQMWGGQRADTQRFHEENLAAQEAAARNAIQWRVADARAAGLHPLYAMGNPGISVGPSGAFAAAPPQLTAPATSGNVEAMTGLGQNIGRAAHAMMTKNERIRLMKHQAAEAAEERDWARAERRVNLERGMLQNNALRAEIMLAKQQLNPPAPPVGRVREFDGPNPRLQPRPSEPIVGDLEVPALQPGARTSFQYEIQPGGGLRLTPSEEARRNMEDAPVQALNWYFSNSILPLFSAERRRAQVPQLNDHPLPPGMEWRYDWFAGEYQPRRVRVPRRRRGGVPRHHQGRR